MPIQCCSRLNHNQSIFKIKGFQSTPQQFAICLLALPLTTMNIAERRAAMGFSRRRHVARKARPMFEVLIDHVNWRFRLIAAACGINHRFMALDEAAGPVGTTLLVCTACFSGLVTSNAAMKMDFLTPKSMTGSKFNMSRSKHIRHKCKTERFLQFSLQPKHVQERLRRLRIKV